MSTGAIALVLALVLASRSAAQEFAGAGPAAGPDGAARLIEHALPDRARGLEGMVAETRWWGLDALRTRTIVVGIGAGSGRLALGLSQTGDPALGWTTLAFAAGAASVRAGAGLRAVARLDRDAPWAVSRAVAHSAHEIGAGAWLEPHRGWHVWASAPALARRGAPPLDRPLACGVRVGERSALWFALRAPRASDDGERACGVVLAIAPLQVWGELRDAPMRAAAGVRYEWRSCALAVRVDPHPVLGQTVRMELVGRVVRGGP
jgi:hypothetical protein